MNQVYDRAGFDYRVNYAAEPPEPLSQTEKDWIAQQLQAQNPS